MSQPTPPEIVGRNHLAFLKPGVEVVTSLRGEPDSRSEYVVELEHDGTAVRLSRVEDVGRYIGEITSADEALRFLDLLRSLGLPSDSVPGLPHSNPARGGLRPDFEAGLVSMGVDPAPKIVETRDEFEVTMPLVDWRVGDPHPRVILVRETVGRGGAYRVEVVRTLKDGPEVESLIAVTR